MRKKFTDLQTIINGNVIIVSIAETRLDASFQSLLKRQMSGTLSDNEGQRMRTSGTTSDNKWQRVVQRVTTDDKEWQRVITSDNEWQQATKSDNEWYNEWLKVTMSDTTVVQKMRTGQCTSKNEWLTSFQC